MDEYKRTIDDELDWSLLDQLHAVVLQISSFCFRTKQICITVLIGVVGVIAAFSEGEIDHSIFVAGYLIPACFWFLDSIAYYYQVKIRGAMDILRDKLRLRGRVPELENDTGVIEDERIDNSQLRMTINAFINHSMWMYFILFLANTAVFALYGAGKIS